MKYILIYIIIINLITFAAYGIDKLKAKTHQWRISEKTLLSMCLIGGFLGGFMGMKFFHHKTRHWYFYAVIFISAVIWLYLIYRLCK